MIGSLLNSLNVYRLFDDEVANDTSEIITDPDKSIPIIYGNKFEIIYDPNNPDNSTYLPIEVIQYIAISFFSHKDLISSILTCKNWNWVFDEKQVRLAVLSKYVICNENEDKEDVAKRQIEYIELTRGIDKSNLYFLFAKNQSIFLNFFHRKTIDNEELFRAILGPKTYEKVPMIKNSTHRLALYYTSFEEFADFYEFSITIDWFRKYPGIFRSHTTDIIKWNGGDFRDFKEKSVALQFTVHETHHSGMFFPKCYGNIFMNTFGDIPYIDFDTKIYYEDTESSKFKHLCPNNIKASRKFSQDFREISSNWLWSRVPQRVGRPDFYLAFVSKLMNQPEVTMSFATESESYERTFVLGLE